MKKRQNLWLVILTIWLVQLACSDQVKPDDWRLQAPLTTVGMELSKFTDQLKGIPGGVMAPWITSPPDRSFNSERTIVVEGWAPYFRNAQLVLYQVEPNEAVTRAVSTVKSISSTNVDAEYNWQIEVELTDQQQFLAVRLELQNGKMSAFSNIIFVSLGEPKDLVITLPAQDEVVQSDLITLMGTGQPGLGLTVWINGESSQQSSFVDANGNWKIGDIPLTIQGFDGRNQSQDPNRNTIKVETIATHQSAEVVIRRIETIQLLWPFGDGDVKMGETYKPRLEYAQVSAFFRNDWHNYSRTNRHPALDIHSIVRPSSNKGRPIHSVSDGIVVGFGTVSSGNYLIVDSGGWGVLYLHIVENARQSKVALGQEVKAGEIIATEGGSGGFPIHLHIGVCVWQPFADRSLIDSLTKGHCINLNPPIEYQAHFNQMNIELFHLWGGSEYCHPDGCWKDVDWNLVELRQAKPSSTYNSGCINNAGRWVGGWPTSPYATRRNYCETFPDRCRCQ